MTISHLEPKALWQHFQLLCDTPRPSNHEALLKQRIIELIEETNRSKGTQITYFEDEVGNLILKKPAYASYEQAPGIILQSHLDIVAQQNEGTGHDFFNDPIKAYVDGDWVTAEGTTLGADNGIGVAAILAVLCDPNIIHGPLEALLTINEESGMTGAYGLSPQSLTGKWLLNLDTEEEGELFIGCAGGIDINADWTYTAEAENNNLSYIEVSVKGLKGGHSGVDIHLDRANANKLLIRILRLLGNECSQLRIASVHGGTMRNAIPREAFAVLAVPKQDLNKIEQALPQIQEIFQLEYKTTDPGLQITYQQTSSQPLIPNDIWSPIQLSLNASANGVLRKSNDFEGVTETSNNLSIVTAAKGKIEVQCLVRSLIDSQRDEAAASVSAAFQLAGAKVTLDGATPGWKPNKDSRLMKELSRIHAEKLGYPPKIQVIHAGLECGLLGQHYPHWDMISFGPTIQGAHSPDEAVKISSVATFWDFLKAGLQHLATVSE